MKYSSIGDSIAIKESMNIKDEESIVDEVGSPSNIEESIKESIMESDRKSEARRHLGSEQAIITQSREILSNK